MSLLTVATLNVRGWFDLPPPHGKLNIDRLAKYVNDIKPHILCLQEANARRKGNIAWPLEDFKKKTGFTYHVESPDSSVNCSILTSLHLEGLETSHRGPRFVIGRVSLNDSSSVVVTCVHLDHKDEKKRLKELEKIQDDVTKLVGDTEFQIWAGDFNSLRREDYTNQEWKEIGLERRKNQWEKPCVAVAEKMKMLGFTDSWMKAGRPKPLATCRFNTHIDYIFTNKEMDAIWNCSEVMHTGTQNATDHYLVVASFACSDTKMHLKSADNTPVLESLVQDDGSYIERSIEMKERSIPNLRPMMMKMGCASLGAKKIQYRSFESYIKEGKCISPLSENPILGMTSALPSSTQNKIQQQFHVFQGLTFNGIYSNTRSMLGQEETVRKRYAMSSVPNDQDPFYNLFEMAQILLESHGKHFKSIDVVANRTLGDNFSKKQQTFSQNGIKPMEFLAFHGTHPNKVDSIIKNNFQFSESVRQKCGEGIYFYSGPNSCCQYGEALILCRILPGNISNSTKEQQIPSGFNSRRLRLPKEKDEMLLINNSDQILPAFVIYNWEK